MDVENMSYVTRDVQVITSKELGIEYLNPENLMIRFDWQTRKHPYDFGSLAFTKRRPQPIMGTKGSKTSSASPVVVGSLRNERKVFISRAFEHFTLVQYRDSSLYTKMRIFKQIFDWCDSNGHEGFLGSEKDARSAYKAFVSVMSEELKQNSSERSPKTCNERQRAMKSMIEIFFGESIAARVFQGVRMIKFKRTPLDVPDEKNVRSMTSVCVNLFSQFSDFVLENRPFPFKLVMPEYTTFLFPKKGGGIATPYTTKRLPIYNYELGRVSTEAEYASNSVANITEEKIAAIIDKEKRNIAVINDTPRHQERLKYATLAAQAYLQLFWMTTGINTSELVTLEYDEDYKREKDLFKNDFRGIKFRAKGRETAYFLGDRHGYRLLQNYLELRDWLLDGQKFKYLFFLISKDGVYTDTPSQLNTGDIGRLTKRINGIFAPKGTKAIPPSLARKYKDSVLHELGTDPVTVAAVMQHTPETNIKDYSQTTVNKQHDEFSKYWAAAKAANKLIKINTTNERNESSIAAGHCDDHGSPESIQPLVPIEPNCKTQYGCLYCKHYSVHADEEDIHKLLSLSYLATELRRYAINTEHVDGLFKELSIRIKLIIDAVKQKSEKHAEMVAGMEYRVMELGELTHYWEQRLQRYERLGVVV